MKEKKTDCQQSINIINGTSFYKHNHQRRKSIFSLVFLGCLLLMISVSTGCKKEDQQSISTTSDDQTIHNENQLIHPNFNIAIDKSG